MPPNETPFPPPFPFPFPFPPPPPLTLPLLPPPPPPPPPTFQYFHYHYNLHLLSGDDDHVVTEISQQDMSILQSHDIPIVPANNMFIHNHFALRTQPLSNQIQEEPEPWQLLREEHHYVHMHYHHFGPQYDGWDDDFDVRHFKNHVPSDQHLIDIENQFPQHPPIRVLHIHNHKHWDEDEMITSDMFYSSEEDGEEGGDDEEEEQEDDD